MMQVCHFLPAVFLALQPAAAADGSLEEARRREIVGVGGAPDEVHGENFLEFTLIAVAILVLLFILLLFKSAR